VEPRFVVDGIGNVSPADGTSPLEGRQGYFRLQSTSPDWLLFLKSPAEGGTSPVPRIVLAGDVAGFPVQDLMAFLAQARWTGVVRLSAPGAERTLVLKDGDVRTGSSDAATDRLGELLVRMGYVTRPQLESVLAQTPPSRLGKTLVERGLLESHDLYKCLNEQMTEIFHGMMLAKEGCFTLLAADFDDKGHTLSLSVQGLLMDSIRKIDELAQFRKRIPHGQLYVQRKKPSDGKLEPDEDALLALVDGQTTVLQLGQAAKVSEFDATRIVYRLLEGGYATVATMLGSPAVRPASSGPLDAHQIINTFNVIFKEVRNEVDHHGKIDLFLASANAALRGSGVSASRVLGGLGFSPDGTIDASLVLNQFSQLKGDGQMGSEPLMTLKQALSDVMFFLLFQAGELLESRADEDLARRVKGLLATLDDR
jgi:hypothetical protein